MFAPCLLIPVYNHERPLAAVLTRLEPFGIRCILVDDGSDPQGREAVAALHRQHASWTTLHRHGRNRGKGAAVTTGLRGAAAQGYTHAVQLDADGQHRPEDVARFLEVAQQRPEAVVMGDPVYDGSAPPARLYGRYLTRLWVRINTLSLDIHDALCGFRVYPVQRTLAVIDGCRLGDRMEFDCEILVRLHWQGVPVMNLPTPIVYPADGRSHFRLWRDNVRISAMHARLFCGMLRRLPRLVARRLTCQAA